MQRYQGGDPDAFDDLYRRYFDRLHGYCQRRVGDRHVAEELAQEAFARALRAMPTFAGERRFYPWMTVIAQRLCIDHHRRRARIEPAAEIDLGFVEADHDALFAAVDIGHLATAMDRLAPRHREVLELREHEGLSYQDIATRLDVPISTVEALLHRARKALRREFTSVAGGHRVWGIPLLGVLASRIGGLRARIGDRVPELIAVAAPTAAAVATAAVVMIPGSGATQVDTSSPRGAEPARAAAVSSESVGSPSSAALDATDAVSLPNTTPAVPVEVTPAQPTVRLGASNLYTGDAATAKGQEMEEMPTYVDLGPVDVGADSADLVEKVTAKLGLPIAGGAR